MKFIGICPITEETASIDIHPIYCGSNEHPGYYMKGRIVSCSVQGPKKAAKAAALSSRTPQTYSGSIRRLPTAYERKGV